MLGRIVAAVAILIVVGLTCLLLATIFGAVGIPVVEAIGDFLGRWAWVIAIAAALYAFATGRTIGPPLP